MPLPNKFGTRGKGQTKFTDALNEMLKAIRNLQGMTVAGPLAIAMLDGKPVIYLDQPPSPFTTFKLKANKPQGGPGETAPVKGIELFECEQSGYAEKNDFEHDIYFRYAPGGFLKDQWVRCQRVCERWEVHSEGFHGLTGVLKNPLKTLGIATLQVAIYGATHEVDVYGLFFEENQNEAIGALWMDNMQLWVAIAKVCKPGEGVGGGDHPPPTGCEFGYCRFVYGGGVWNRVGDNCSGGGICPLTPVSPPPAPENLDVYDECCNGPADPGGGGASAPAFGIHSRGGKILSIKTAKGRRIGRHLEGKKFPTFKRPEDLRNFSLNLIASSDRRKNSNGRSASSRRPARKTK